MVKKVSKEQMNVLSYIIAVDFDGTLVEDKFPEIGAKREKVWEDMKRAREEGAAIILWTCRDGHNLSDAIEFCASEGFTFDAVNCNVEETQTLFNNDTRKVYANEYWDDKAIAAYSVHQHSSHLRETENRDLLEATKPLMNWLERKGFLKDQVFAENRG